jgi:cobalt/nickel transport system permease protein
VLARRLTIELPFVGFAILLPFLSPGHDVDVLGISLSSDGLWAAWNILVKGTLGIAATAVLAATTPVPSLLRGLERLHMPHIVTAVAGFMIRYGDVLTAESNRMRVARLSRGYDPRWFWQVKAVATSTGTLFVRSFERGERVYLAMLSRGFSGTMPSTDVRPDASVRDWAVPMAAPAAAAAITAAAWTLR